MMQIAPQHLTLQQLLTDRLFRIPEYQRSYSWGTRQREDLFQDIKQSYRKENSSDHFMATVIALVRDKVNIPGSLGEHRNVDIVDGQQRITTLVLLLKAIAKSLDQSDTVEASLRSNLEKMLVKADGATLCYYRLTKILATISRPTFERGNMWMSTRSRLWQTDSCSTR